MALLRRLRALLRAVWAVLGVIVRRIFRGPRLPQWSLRLEALAAIMRNAAQSGGGDGAGIGTDDPLRTIESPIPRHLRERVRLERRELAGLYTEVLTPRGWQDGGATVFHLHGGGYVTCSPRSHRGWLARVADAASARIVSIDYRKAPEHPFPAAVEDSVAAYRALLAEGCDPARLAVGGDSAGGGLALATLQRLREAGEPLPAVVVLISPWVDLGAEGGSMIDNRDYDYLVPRMVERVADAYVAGQDRGTPLISPLHADYHGMPPMLIQSGGAEIFLSQNAELAERARAAGVEVVHDVEEGMIHVYQAFSDFEPRGRRAIARIGEFLGPRLGAAPTPGDGA